MGDDKHTKRRAQSEKNKTLLGFGVVGVVEEETVLVRKSRLGLLEGNTVLPRI